MNAASTLARPRFATWSRIRAISGETTSVRPTSSAGRTKQALLPLPVGMTPTTSLSASASSTSA